MGNVYAKGIKKCGVEEVGMIYDRSKLKRAERRERHLADSTKGHRKMSHKNRMYDAYEYEYSDDEFEY